MSFSNVKGIYLRVSGKQKNKKSIVNLEFGFMYVTFLILHISFISQWRVNLDIKFQLFVGCFEHWVPDSDCTDYNRILCLAYEMFNVYFKLKLMN